MQIFRLLTILMLIAISSTLEIPEKRQVNSDTTLCSTGPTPFGPNSPVTFTAQNGRIYVDSHPVVCYGRVEQIEICFRVDNDVSGEPVLDIIVLRPGINGGYFVQTALSMRTNRIIDTESQNEILYCQNVTVPATTPIFVQNGDLLGFRVTSGILVAFTAFEEVDSALHSVTIQPSLGPEYISRAELTEDRRNDQELPMFRGFVGK